MKQTVTLNVGLLTNELPHRDLSKVTVLSTLASLGFRVLIHRELTADEAGGGEPTLAVLALPPEDWTGALYLAACELHQTAIAASFDGGTTGHLIGPGASSWGGGAFAPEWFFPV
jgi:hypothetical protein